MGSRGTPLVLLLGLAGTHAFFTQTDCKICVDANGAVSISSSQEADLAACEAKCAGTTLCVAATFDDVVAADSCKLYSACEDAAQDDQVAPCSSTLLVFVEDSTAPDTDAPAVLLPVFTSEDCFFCDDTKGAVVIAGGETQQDSNVSCAATCSASAAAPDSCTVATFELLANAATGTCKLYTSCETTARADAACTTQLLVLFGESAAPDTEAPAPRLYTRTDCRTCTEAPISDVAQPSIEQCEASCTATADCTVATFDGTNCQLYVTCPLASRTVDASTPCIQLSQAVEPTNAPDTDAPATDPPETGAPINETLVPPTPAPQTRLAAPIVTGRGNGIFAAITIVSPDNGTIFYTMDGTAPTLADGTATAGATEYTEPFVVFTNDLLLRATAVIGGVISDVTDFTVSVYGQLPPPIFSSRVVNKVTGDTIELTLPEGYAAATPDNVNDIEVYFTRCELSININASTPRTGYDCPGPVAASASGTPAVTKYTVPIVLVEGVTVISAATFQDGSTTSSAVSQTYLVYPQAPAVKINPLNGVFTGQVVLFFTTAFQATGIQVQYIITAQHASPGTPPPQYVAYDPLVPLVLQELGNYTVTAFSTNTQMAEWRASEVSSSIIVIEPIPTNLTMRVRVPTDTTGVDFNVFAKTIAARKGIPERRVVMDRKRADPAENADDMQLIDFHFTVRETPFSTEPSSLELSEDFLSLPAVALNDMGIEDVWLSADAVPAVPQEDDEIIGIPEGWFIAGVIAIVFCCCCLLILAYYLKRRSEIRNATRRTDAQVALMSHQRPTEEELRNWGPSESPHGDYMHPMEVERRMMHRDRDRGAVNRPKKESLITMTSAASYPPDRERDTRRRRERRKDSVSSDSSESSGRAKHHTRRRRGSRDSRERYRDKDRDRDSRRRDRDYRDESNHHGYNSPSPRRSPHPDDVRTVAFPDSYAGSPQGFSPTYYAPPTFASAVPVPPHLYPTYGPRGVSSSYNTAAVGPLAAPIWNVGPNPGPPDNFRDQQDLNDMFRKI
ncbi:hypothetical protein DIPPA_02811 [Diplonema papillatum]|nr:hypothetical protein DIPPA_02811 [Diplonema papillatum]